MVGFLGEAARQGLFFRGGVSDFLLLCWVGMLIIGSFGVCRK